MRRKIYFSVAAPGRAKALTLGILVTLAFSLAGCATTDDESMTLISKKLSTCEQDLLDIKEALCEKIFDGKPKTDPHEVIGLAKPKTDPHKTCFSSWTRLSTVGGQVCECEIETSSWMGLINGCYESANDDPVAYSKCLDKVRNYFGVGCPVWINRE